MLKKKICNNNKKKSVAFVIVILLCVRCVFFCFDYSPILNWDSETCIDNSFFMVESIYIHAELCSAGSVDEWKRYTNWILCRKWYTINTNRNEKNVHIYCSLWMRKYLFSFVLFRMFNCELWWMQLIFFMSIRPCHELGSLRKITTDKWNETTKKMHKSWSQNHLHVIQIVLCECAQLQIFNLFKLIGYTISLLIHVTFGI